MDVDRLRTLARPGHRRSTAIRRALAAGLVLAAFGSLLVDATRSDPTVTTFARDLPAGALLATEDLAQTRLPDAVTPANAVADPSLAAGQILAAGAAAGEVVTTTRLVGPDLVSGLVVGEPPGEEFTMVPLALAEKDILPMLHHGARVDVVGQGPAVIAQGGRIVTVGEEGAVLVLLRRPQAAAVAAASLTDPLTVVLSGGSYGLAPPGNSGG